MTRTAILGSRREDACLAEEARSIRLAIAEALYSIPAGGHYGGCFSVVEILLALYHSVFPEPPHDPNNPDRSRLILSKGHAAMALYAVLRRFGFFSDELHGYGSYSSRLEGHPDMLALSGVDFSSGSLGQGLSVAAGMALAFRERATPVWAVLGDGECQEGQIWEAAMFASVYHLGNLQAVVDCNGFQECGWQLSGLRAPLAPVPNLAAKWSSFGWKVITCDGHSFSELTDSLRRAATWTEGPAVILAKTTKGKGAPLVEGDAHRFHCASVDEAEHQLIIRQILAG